MIIPTVPIRVATVVGRDLYAQPKLSRWRNDLCSVVRLDFEQNTTTVRTDSSGTQGHAREPGHIIVILVQRNSCAAKMDAIIELHKRRLRVKRIEPRHAATGELDHYELELEPWALN